MALCGGTVLEEPLDLSSDRILNEWIHTNTHIYVQGKGKGHPRTRHEGPQGE
jgi:hypothetical protein